MDGPSDHDLMAQAALGDERAFRTLVARHTRLALSIARRILRNDARAEAASAFPGALDVAAAGQVINLDG